MIVLNLTGDNKVYTCNVYLVRGSHNAIPDVNTLVDVGRDLAILKAIESVSTGVGKKRVDQVVVTHSHYDHTELLPRICQEYRPTVYSFSPQVIAERYECGKDEDLADDYVSGKRLKKIRDNDRLRLGDRTFEILHAPGHSHDSVCLYNGDDGVLFSGDTPLDIRTPDQVHEEGFIRLIRRLVDREIRTIYPGHGEPITGICNKMIGNTLRNITGSGVVPA